MYEIRKVKHKLIEYSSSSRNSELQMTVGVLAPLEICRKFPENALDFSRVWNGRLKVMCR